MTTRFNNKTWEESNRLRKTYSSIINTNIQNVQNVQHLQKEQEIEERKEKINCIYCSSQKIMEKIQPHSFLFIIEMNNDTNKIEGIGLVRNTILYTKIKVHEENDFNRYIYAGYYWLIEEILTRELPLLMEVFTQLLFKGKTHSKRGRGILRFPQKLFRNKLFDDIGNEEDVKKILLSTFSKFYKN